MLDEPTTREIDRMTEAELLADARRRMLARKSTDKSVLLRVEKIRPDAP